MLLRTRNLTAASVAACLATTALAAITPSGDITPANPATWTSTTTAYISSSGNASLTIDSGFAVSSKTVYAGQSKTANADLSIDGSGSTWTNGYAFYLGASGGHGTLSITNGGKLKTGTYAYFGSGLQSTAAATVDGTGSTLSVSSQLYVGSSTSSASIDITNGGTVSVGSEADLGSAAGSTGTVSVNGNGSSFSCTSILDIGTLGNGTLKLTGGGTFNSKTSSYIAWGDNAVGTLQVDGAGSIWSTGTLYAGYKGTCIVSVSNGGAIANNSAIIADYAAASANITVDGASSSWSNGSLSIASAGSATVAISNGAKLTSANSTIGELAGATGDIIVDSSNSTWTVSGRLYVGQLGSGALTLGHGSQCTVSGSTYLAYNDGSSGTVSFGTGGGILTTGCLYAAPSHFSGNGTINTTGLVADLDLVLDAHHGLAQTLSWNNPGQSITVNLDLTGASAAVPALGVGYHGTGSLTIRDGVGVTSAVGYLGFGAASSGTAIVSGAGSAWTTTGSLYVGNNGTGSLTISDGASFSSPATVYVGYLAGSRGDVTVDGADSQFVSSLNLYIGNSGSGSLTISHGASVKATFATYVGDLSTGSGAIRFQEGGGSLTANAVFVSPSQLSGTGTIDTHGLVSDVNLVFDSAHGLVRSLLFAGSDRNVMVNLDLSSSANYLGVGYCGSGTLIIRDGCSINTSFGYLGYRPGASGWASVRGASTAWRLSSGISVGYGGTGYLEITEGALLSSDSGSDRIGANTGSKGTASVRGAGSCWQSLVLLVGSSTGGIGTLNIADGGKVTANILRIYNASLLNVEVGNNSLLDLGSGTLTNNGTMRLIAAPSAAPGNYTPVTAGTWSGTGTVQALGGTWDAAHHTFTIAAATLGAAGNAVTIDRLSVQRITITDAASHAVTANFLASATSSTVHFTASAFTSAQTSPLYAILGGDSILAGWNFSTDYASGQPVYLTMDVGPDLDPADLAVYHYDGSTWSAYTPADLTYDGQHASFTVTGFSGYAVAQLPEPASLSLLALGGVGLLVRRRRR